MAEGRGRSLLLAHGFTAEKYWWRKAKWDALQPRRLAIGFIAAPC
jgi:hypothetical protein